MVTTVLWVSLAVDPSESAGLTDIATALRRSVSVRRVEFPGCDAAAGGRGASERVAALWRDLHER